VREKFLNAQPVASSSSLGAIVKNSEMKEEKMDVEDM